MYAFFIGSKPIQTDGDVESPHAPQLFIVLEKTCSNLFAVFSPPYKTSVIPAAVSDIGISRLE
jgi:hypothetical protein